MAKIKKGDLVQVISGAKQDRGGDRGKQGRVIEVLAEKNRVKVVSTPHVMVTDNSPALISIGENIPYAAESSITNGVVQTTTSPWLIE